METFESIFGRDGSWPEGPAIFREYVELLKGRHLIALRDMDNPLILGISAPLLEGLPEYIYPVFIRRMNTAIAEYLGDDGRGLLEAYLREVMSNSLLDRVNSSLAEFEEARRARGFGTLAEFCAKALGVSLSVTHITLRSTFAYD